MNEEDKKKANRNKSNNTLTFQKTKQIEKQPTQPAKDHSTNRESESENNPSGHK